MPIRNYPQRVLIIAIVSCLLLAGLCGTVAITLAGELSRTATILGEDIDSRGAAINLEASLNNLAALHEHNASEVEPLIDQVRSDLAEIGLLANKPEEIRLLTMVKDRYAEYSNLDPAVTTPSIRARFVREQVLPPAIDLRIYNGKELRFSEESHLLALRQIVWGLAVVGVLGSVAGLILGYGLARSLQRTIHQFLVRIQGATDRLGQEVPTVEWQRYGEPLRDGGDELIRRVEQVVSKLQQQELEVRRAERLAAVGQLAAGVAHEIRNPLTSAILLLETSRLDPTAGGLTEEDHLLIEAELHRIEKSLQLLLDYARPPKLARTQVDLVTIAREALALVRGRCDQQHVQVTLAIPKNPVCCDADGEQIRQVILNLILNALDVMPHGGALTVRIANHGGRLKIEVEDQGPGISPEIFPRLFEPFASGKETGLGLGLVISRRIVEEHGGKLTAENVAGAGARFTVSLPTRQAETE